jgi:hypothetical protein
VRFNHPNFYDPSFTDQRLRIARECILLHTIYSSPPRRKRQIDREFVLPTFIFRASRRLDLTHPLAVEIFCLPI